jgi:hypothetical protein
VRASRFIGRPLTSYTLGRFGEECKKDNITLQARETQVKAKLTGVGGEIEQLQKQIKADMTDLEADEKEVSVNGAFGG